MVGTSADLAVELKKRAFAHSAIDPALLTPSQLNPRNKALLKEGVAQAAGSVYNALKVKVLDEEQLAHLHAKITSVNVGMCREDPESSSKSAKANKDGTVSTVRPRGLLLDAPFRYGVFSAPTDQTKANISWEKTHIVAAFAGNFPPSSEHEISHLCHNPQCVKASHLLWEFHPENVGREVCRFTRDLECPACAHCFSLCKHTPKCASISASS